MLSNVKTAGDFIAAKKPLMRKTNVIGLESTTNARKVMSLSHLLGFFRKPLPIFSHLRSWEQHERRLDETIMDTMKRFCRPPEAMVKPKKLRMAQRHRELQ